jgi:hypothetical protein
MSMARGRWCACDVEEQEEARRTHDIERLEEATDKVEAQRGLETHRKARGGNRQGGGAKGVGDEAKVRGRRRRRYLGRCRRRANLREERCVLDFRGSFPGSRELCLPLRIAFSPLKPAIAR